MSNKSQGNLKLLQGNNKSTNGDSSGAVVLYREAITFYKAAIITDQDTSSETKNNLGAAYLNLGSELIKSNKSDEAIIVLEEAESAGYTSEGIYLNLGIAYFNEQDNVKAITAFEQAITLDDTIANYHYNLGLAYQKNTELDKAITSFSKAKTLLPNDPNIIKALIYAHSKFIESTPTPTLSSMEKAFTDFENLSQTDKTTYKDYGIFIYSHLATKYLIDHKEVDANNILTKSQAFDLQNTILPALRELALFKYSHAHKEEAVKMLLCLRDMAYEPAQDILGDICLSCHKDDLAIKFLAGDQIVFGDCNDLL